jgi:hypothetical protein
MLFSLLVIVRPGSAQKAPAAPQSIQIRFLEDKPEPAPPAPPRCAQSGRRRRPGRGAVGGGYSKIPE